MPTLTRMVPFGRPMISDAEREAVQEVLAGHILTHGPRVRDFEAAFAAFTGAPHALAVNSCTAGMHLAWLALGLKPGDEVIVPAQTHVASAHAVELAGGRCVFADVDRTTGNIDLEHAATLVGPRTRGLCVVHYLGLPVDMTAAVAFAKQHDLALVEDCALAVGATFEGTHVGLHGDAGCFSFYPVKHLTTAEGGMVITTRADVARQVGMQRAFGIDRNDPESREIPGHYDAVMPGNNYRMHEIGAAMGVEQMKRLPGFLATRERHFAEIARGLGDVALAETLAATIPGAVHAHYGYPLILKGAAAHGRRRLMDDLKARGVGVSIYYPRPVPLMTHYRRTGGYEPGSFPVAESISEASVTLPVGPHLEDEDVTYLIEVVRESLAAIS